MEIYLEVINTYYSYFSSACNSADSKRFFFHSIQRAAPASGGNGDCMRLRLLGERTTCKWCLR